MKELGQQIETATSGVVGALVALRWIGGNPWQLASAFVGGVGLAWYATPEVARWFGVSQGLTGFLLGLFGMAVVNRIFEGIASIPIGKVLEKVLRKVGLG